MSTYNDDERARRDALGGRLRLDGAPGLEHGGRMAYEEEAERNRRGSRRAGFALLILGACLFLMGTGSPVGAFIGDVFALIGFLGVSLAIVMLLTLVILWPLDAIRYVFGAKRLLTPTYLRLISATGQTVLHGLGTLLSGRARIPEPVQVRRRRQERRAGHRRRARDRVVVVPPIVIPPPHDEEWDDDDL